MSSSKNQPTLYEYYTSNGRRIGLDASQPHFELNNIQITILSGAMHYFRIHPSLWRDRLQKLRASGLNTVETYVPWNLHEPKNGHFDFGHGDSDFTAFLNLKAYIKMAQDEDLFVILRPGPYICAEWEFGGLPAWLLAETDVRMRCSEQNYLNFVRRYFKVLLGEVTSLQWTKGGSIIAFQIENEYGSVKDGDNVLDLNYLEELKRILVENGVVELLFTSDNSLNGHASAGAIPGVLATINFQENATKELQDLKKFQPGKPVMVMEYWTGWYNHWGEKHQKRSCELFTKVLQEILAANASFNLYMFHGGTNWGFMNGANVSDHSSLDNSSYQPDISSYDYDALLTEAGDYTPKYHQLKALIQNHNSHIKTPEMPALKARCTYPSIKMEQFLTMNQLIAQNESKLMPDLVPMEKVGQSYGYIVYRKTNLDIPANSVLKIHCHVCDTVMVLVNGVLKSPILEKINDLDGFGTWKRKNSTLDLGEIETIGATLDLVVENLGRINYGTLKQFNRQFKGLWHGKVQINDDVVNNWEVVPMEFESCWNRSLRNWERINEVQMGPGLFKGVLEVDDLTGDSFLDMRNWGKGIVIVNGFVLSRFWNLGPQLSVYLPGAFLKKGRNEILIFEHFRATATLQFVQSAIIND